MIKLKTILSEGPEQSIINVVKKYGGEHARRYKGTGIYFKWTSDDSKSKSQAEKAAKHLEKTIEDYEITTVSPTGVHGKVWLWVMA